MTTARIIGIPGVHVVDVDPLIPASLEAAAKAIGACPGEQVEFTFNDANKLGGVQTYLVRHDLTLVVHKRVFKSAAEQRAWFRSQLQPEPAQKWQKFDLWLWVLEKWGGE